MDSKTIRGAFIGVGILLAVVIVGLFTFNYFSRQVAVEENTITVVTVSSADGSQDLGIVYVDTGKLVTTVTDSEFKKYFYDNNEILLNADYTYKADTIDVNDTLKNAEITTNKNLEDFAYGLKEKFATDLKDKYTFDVQDVVLSK